MAVDTVMEYDDDVEIDGSPCPPRVRVQQVHSDALPSPCLGEPSKHSRHKPHPFGKFVEEERLHSNSSSLGYHSLGSGSIGSDISEGRIPSEDFKKLSISQDDKRLQSIDEGYSDEPLDLSKPKTREEDVKKSEGSEVDLDVYERQLNELYQQDDDGDTRLHTSIIQLLFQYALYFISLAPTPDLLNIKNNFQQTALHLAAITRQPELSRKLLTSGAQVDAKDHHGNTPLHIAAKEGYMDVCAVLLEPVRYSEIVENSYDIPYQPIPQNLEARNYNGQVCLHLAAENCHIEILAFLLAKGADINCRDGKSGRTVLHYAAESGQTEVLKFLLSHPSINVHTQTYSRQTPIMLAEGRGHKEIVRLLKEKGAVLDSDESDEEEMMDDSYDDFKIGGNPV